MGIRVFAVACMFTCLISAASAQEGVSGRGVTAGEFVVGHAGFVDDATKHHGVFGGAVRWYLTPRVSVGPEIVYMRGPGDDRDLFFTGNLTFDFFSPAPGRLVTPFVVAGGGWFRHSDRIGSAPFSSGEGALTGGIGVRGRIFDRWYVGVEARLGWELHTRVTAVLGLRLR